MIKKRIISMITVAICFFLGASALLVAYFNNGFNRVENSAAPITINNGILNAAQTSGLERVDGVSVIGDNTVNGKKDGNKITSGGSGIIADYKISQSVNVSDCMLRLDLNDKAFMTKGSYVEAYLKRGGEELAINLSAAAVGFKMSMILRGAGEDKTFSLGTAPLAPNEYDGFAEVFAVSFGLVPDIKTVGQLNWVVKYNSTKKELRGKAEEADFIAFLNNKEKVTFGFRCSSAEDSALNLDLKQMVGEVYYETTVTDGSAPVEDGDISYSKIYVRWQGKKETSAKATVFTRYNDKGAAQFQMVFPTAERSTFTDKDLNQGSTYVYKIELVDSANVAVPKVIERYEDITMTTLEGHIINIIIVIGIFLFVCLSFILIYTFLPSIREKRKAKKIK